MKKLRRFIFCLILSLQATTGLLCFFSPGMGPMPNMHKENPLKNVGETF